MKTKSKNNIVNSLIGSFGINRDEIQKKDIITSSKEEAHYYFWQFGGQALIRRIITEDDRELYRITKYDDVIRFDNNLPIRTQIVQRENMEAYKLYEYVKNHKSARHSFIPISVQIDCVYYAHRINDARIREVNPKEFGGYRLEDAKNKKFTKTDDYIGMPNFKKQNFDGTASCTALQLMRLCKYCGKCTRAWDIKKDGKRDGRAFWARGARQ